MQGGHRHHPIEEPLLLDRRRLVGVPEDGDAVDGRPELVHLGVELAAAVVGVLRRVLGEAELRPGGGRIGAGERDNAEECRSDELHRTEQTGTGGDSQSAVRPMFAAASAYAAASTASTSRPAP